MVSEVSVNIPGVTHTPRGKQPAPVGEAKESGIGGKVGEVSMTPARADPVSAGCDREPGRNDCRTTLLRYGNAHDLASLVSGERPLCGSSLISLEKTEVSARESPASTPIFPSKSPQ